MSSDQNETNEISEMCTRCKENEVISPTNNICTTCYSYLMRKYRGC